MAAHRSAEREALMPFVPTPGSIRQINRRLDRRNAARERREHTAAAILRAMRDDGVTLHRCNRNHRILWSLSSGQFITHEAATDVLRDLHVVGVGDCLFGPELSQTFRYVEEVNSTNGVNT